MPQHQTPDRSLTQRMDALKRANDIRTRRARFKRDLKTGRESIAERLLDPPEWLETAKVGELVLALPKYGRVKTNKVLAGCAVSPSKTVGGLTVRQRAELVGMLGESPARRRARERAAAAAARDRADELRSRTALA